ncbi:hypothetical protein AAW51_2248 [Caldimonas brevitalea]|uniref:Uncharacterized protein n=1 Tax=Caldimonas brevitalea TaxID=413882 RepID=A0A0G3BHM5_9BURK|nr:hypothetical protein AAW51_2248 [Caldimonas brevitalea]
MKRLLSIIFGALVGGAAAFLTAAALSQWHSSSAKSEDEMGTVALVGMAFTVVCSLAGAGIGNRLYRRRLR